MKNNTPQLFALQLGSLISLYLFVSFLLVLLFGLITLKFPDPAEGYYTIESASSSVRLGIAMVLVFFPTYLILTRYVNQFRREKGSEQYLTLTKWLIYISLVVGIGALLIDLVIVIMTFLEGDLTARFLYKAAAVLLVVGAAVQYYVLDARGVWVTHERQSRMFGVGAIVVALAAVILGFGSIATPNTVRDQKLDSKQVSDLQNIQYKIEESYLRSSSTLPQTLEDAFGEFEVPTAPAGRAAYAYSVTAQGFDLCATFAENSLDESGFSGPKIDLNQTIINGYDWQYLKGNFCFKRVVKK